MSGIPNPESRSGKVRAYIAKHPQQTIEEVAKAMGEDESFVYGVVYKMKRKLKPIKVARSFKDLPRLLTKPIVPKEVFREWEVKADGTISTRDVVNHPEHYKVGGVETIDFIEAKKLDYNLGNAVKYISRADYKGNREQDLKKARWYIDRAILASHIG